jgi:hypothetical protein
MGKSEKIKLKGRELANRLTGISPPIGGISWKPPVVEREKARRLLVYLAGERALHYPYDKEIGTFVVESILDTRERLARDIKDLSMDSILRQILRGMQAACRKFLDENQSSVWAIYYLLSLNQSPTKTTTRTREIQMGPNISLQRPLRDTIERILLS